MVRLEMEEDVESWTDWAISAGVNDVVMAYINNNPEKLCDYQVSKFDGKPFATPRTWEFVSKFMNEFPQQTLSEVSVEVLKGMIGEKAAFEFIAYNRVCSSLPSRDDIKNKPETINISTLEPALMYLMAFTLGSVCAELKAITRHYDLLKTFPIEFQKIIFKTATQRCPSLGASAELRAWAKENSIYARAS